MKPSEQRIIEEETKEEKIPSPNKFSIMIVRMAKETGMGYLESILAYCEESGFDVEDVTPLINRSLRDKIQVEAESLNMLKEKSSTVALPI